MVEDKKDVRNLDQVSPLMKVALAAAEPSIRKLKEIFNHVAVVVGLDVVTAKNVDNGIGRTTTGAESMQGSALALHGMLLHSLQKVFQDSIEVEEEEEEEEGTFAGGVTPKVVS